MGHSPIGSLRVKMFFFGAGYCARRLIKRERWIEVSGTARTVESVAALRGDGVEAYQFDGADTDPGLEQALGAAEAIVVSIPPRDGAGATPSLPRRRCGASSTTRPSAFMATTAACGSMRPARRGRERRAD
jgi:hypothetical protein